MGELEGGVFAGSDNIIALICTISHGQLPSSHEANTLNSAIICEEKEVWRGIKLYDTLDVKLIRNRLVHGFVKSIAIILINHTIFNQPDQLWEKKSFFCVFFP